MGVGMTRCLRKPCLPRGPGGRPLTYPDSGILLMAVVQTTWRKSYEQMVDWVATNEALARVLGFGSALRRASCTRSRKVSTGKAASSGHSAFPVLLSGVGGATDPPGSHHRQGIDRGLDPSGSPAQGRSRRSLAAIRRESACLRLQGAYAAV